jgi:hypothetical protein
VRIARGDIWDFGNRGYEVVIPVNCGWKLTGHNVMGRGLAKQALDRYPGIDLYLGKKQAEAVESGAPMGSALWIIDHPDHPLIFFPTKSLNKKQPWLSWKQKSDKKMIGKLLDAFPDWASDRGVKKVAFPLLGAGEGGLDPIEMRDFIRKKLGDDERFVLVTPAYI